MSGVLQNEEFTRRTRKFQAEGTACPKAWALLDCKALGMAGAQGMYGGGQEEHRVGKASW